MLIPFSSIFDYLQAQGKTIKGILHIGAHECEEKRDYNQKGIEDNKIFWVEGNKDKVLLMRMCGVDNIFCAVVDEVERDVTFHITNNGQSSSILPLETHLQHYPHIVVSEERKVRTTTLANLFQEHSIPIEQLNFWNMDIQGAELSAIKGAGEYLKYADYLYLEVNAESLYRGCALLPEMDSYLESKGFERVATNMVQQGWGDALYVRKEG